MNFRKCFAILYLLMMLLIQDAFCQSKSKPTIESTYSALKWRNIGPFRGGRSCAVTGVPGKPNLFYFGATGGGIWKTLDGGRSWANISDGFFGGSIGSISVATSDPNVLYVGGGEVTVRGNVSFGNGLWKSEDAGKTWKSAGLEKSRHIARIRIHPSNPDIVYAAVLGDLFKPTEERGVYKSTDGGKSWKKVLFSNADAGAVDLVIDPTNHRILYASTWNVRRTPYSLSSGGEGSALWKSTDSGDTWSNISSNKGLPTGTWGISGIAVSPLNGDRLYAIIENENGGVFTSMNGGKSWDKKSEDRSLRQRAWYYTRIYADTKDENTCYVMNVSYHKSNDGGSTFKAYNAPHGDHHDLWIAPEDPNRIIIGDDGGAQITYDGGETWSTYHNQPTAQFYRVTTDNHFPYRIYAAQQDNSTVRINHRSIGGSISQADWEETAGSESAHIAVDPSNPDIVYGGSYDGYLTKVNHKTKSERAINVWPDNPMGDGAEASKYRFQWNFPIFFSRHDSTKLFACSQHIHLSTDGGENWRIISPDLTRNEKEKLKSSGGPITKDNTSVEYYATIFAANESPVKEGVIWAGSDDGRINVTKDGGASWTDVTNGKLMPKYMMVNSIEPSYFDEGTCYVAATSYKSGDYLPYLFKTIDFGKTWTKIVKGIGPDQFTRVLRSDPVKKGVLYAGTESGMFISFNDGELWQPFQLNLPIVPITDLAIKDNNLIAATQGRGLWIVDDLTLLHQQLDIKKGDKLFLYKPMDAYRMPGFQIKDVKGEGLNRPAGVSLYFNIDKFDPKKDTIYIDIMEDDGDTIRTFSNFPKEEYNKMEVEQGGNLFAWDLSYPPAKSFDGMIMWGASMSGPKAVPGRYKATIRFGSLTASKDFNVLQAPNSEASLDDLNQQFAFIKSINEKASEAHKAIIDIRSARKQISEYNARIDIKEIKEYGKDIDSLMTKVEEALYQTKNRSEQDPLNFPIRLTNKLLHLSALAQIGSLDFKPTASMLLVRDELTAQIDGQLLTWKDIKQNMIPNLNKMIRDQMQDAIILDKK